MKNSLLCLLALALAGAACSPSPQKEAELLQQEVLALHDSAMAQMGTLYSSRKELAYLRDSAGVGQDSAARQSLSRGITGLEQSDEAMMQWMRAYRNPEDKQPQEARAYLQQEKVKIEKVRDAIAQSLRTADSLRTQYSNPTK
ncbi:hypothetical protein [Rufibacter psychrotolerans]|uniref:hypothetical protein n=1 Tax=Rufibacter psychrotolerans TaxID=2812556 RepID=UPI001968334D|nr:hypothetical protein [Rufibacter sp. SYSU D00308]